jgi:metal-sulfur cluster biosynthetic enzyme
MTLTTPGCPMHDSISTGVKNRVKAINEVENVEVNIVWEPQWDPSKMSDSAKELLW